MLSEQSFLHDCGWVWEKKKSVFEWAGVYGTMGYCPGG